MVVTVDMYQFSLIVTFMPVDLVVLKLPNHITYKKDYAFPNRIKYTEHWYNPLGSSLSQLMPCQRFKLKHDNFAPVYLTFEVHFSLKKLYEYISSA